MNSAELRQRSVRAIWHPYTEMSAFESAEFPVIEQAEGCRLYDVDGRALLDGISSWWCVNLGHSHPRLVAAIREQAGQLQQTLLGGVSHPRAIELAERLAAVVPAGLGHAMFAADGSLAVEAALKIALQYRSNRGETGRTQFIALRDGYHGDSLGAVGVGYLDAFHRPFRAALRPALCTPSPHCNQCPLGLQPDTCGTQCCDAMAALLRTHHAQCTAVIVEPLCQAAAGMRIYPATYLQRLRELCDVYGLLLIADEIAVGFGRTGSMFACEQAGIRPDIITLGKGLTGGMLPMSATLVTDEVYDTFRVRDGQAHTFFHGTTFCGNPITSAVALAALEVYAREGVLERLPEAAAVLHRGMAEVAALLEDAPCRTLGMIAAVELPESAGGAARARRITDRAQTLGLFARPLGATVYLWPPLTTSTTDMQLMLDILRQAVEDTKAGS